MQKTNKNSNPQFTELDAVVSCRSWSFSLKSLKPLKQLLLGSFRAFQPCVTAENCEEIEMIICLMLQVFSWND